MFAGIDIGSRTAKAVLMEDSTYRWAMRPTEADVNGTAEKIREAAVQAGGMGQWASSYTVATGYGRVVVPYADEVITEITCTARAAVWLNPEVRLIIDMGGQDCKAIRCDGNGMVVNFALNEKCAAGTGRYLERIARGLRLTLDEIGPRSLQVVEKPAKVASFCAVFAQNDVVRLVREGKHPNDVLAGAFDSIVQRVMPLLRRMRLEGGEFMVCGGVARNIGMVKRLEEQVGRKAFVATTPDVVAALGAALIAQSHAGRAAAAV